MACLVPGHPGWDLLLLRVDQVVVGRAKNHPAVGRDNELD